MRVLLDENIDRRLKRHFDAGCEVMTIDECGWKGMKNDQLLRAAQDTFDVFVTMDKSLECQQNLRSIRLGIVIVEAQSNRYKDVEVLMPRINTAIKTIRAGDIVHVHNQPNAACSFQ